MSPTSNRPGNQSAWADHSKANLVAPIAPPVRRRERLRPVAILKTPSGQTVVDFGQNIAGRVRLTISGPANKAILLKHGEALDQEGNFSMKHLQLPLPVRRNSCRRCTIRSAGGELKALNRSSLSTVSRYALA